MGGVCSNSENKDTIKLKGGMIDPEMRAILSMLQYCDIAVNF